MFIIMNLDIISVNGLEMPLPTIKEPNTPPIQELINILITAKIKYKVELYTGLIFEWNVIFRFIK